MKLKAKELTRMQNSQIFNILAPLINSIYERFDYIGISQDEFNELVLNEISSSKKIYKGDVSYSEFIKQRIETVLTEKTRGTLQNPQSAAIIINNYINKNFKQFSTYDEALKLLKKLVSFFELLNYLPNADTLLEIIEDNQLFFESIQLIVNKHKSQIISGDIENVFSNSTIILIIESYCMLNNIEIKVDDQLDSIDYNDRSLEITDSVRVYLQEIGRRKLLSREEERELAIKIKKGDTEARKLFIESNLKLVVNIARVYLGRGLAFLDLIQEGNIGLMTAVDKYDVERGFKFSTCATYWIRQAIVRAIADKSRNIRVPAYVYEKIGRYKNVVTNLQEKLNRKPTTAEIANEMGISVSEVTKLHRLQADAVSMNTLIGDDEDTELGSFIPVQGETPEDIAIASTIPFEIKKLFQDCNLKQREIEVLMLRFGFNGREPMTLEEVGKKISVTRERVRQIEAKALMKIRRSRHVKALAVYMQNPSESLERIKEFREKYRETDNPNRTFLKEDGRTRRESDKMPKLQTIYQYFEDYSEEQVNKMLLTLTAEEKNLIRLRYGEDLKNPTATKITAEQRSEFYGKLVPKMKRLLAKANEENNETEPREKFQREGQNRINSIVGEQPVDVGTKEALEGRFSQEECLKFLELLRTPTFGDIMKALSAKDAVIIALKLGYIEGNNGEGRKFFTTESIAQFLGIEPAEVIETTKKVLLFYRQEMAQMIDTAIEIATGEDATGKPCVLVKRQPSNPL